MKTLKNQQKLNLNKETIIRLGEMNQVKGGALTADCASRIRIFCDSAKCSAICVY